MSKLYEFALVYRQYRQFHTRRYAIKRAWDVVVRGLPF